MSRTMMITGAARGIGLTTARYFAEKGWRVGLYDRDSEAIAEVLQQPEFGRCFGGVCDVTDDESVTYALQHFAEQTHDVMDVLVNNAGVLSAGYFEELDLKEQNKMIEVNVLGVMRMAHAAFPLLSDTPGSTLVNLCSVSSIHGVPTLAIYSASKFFVNGFTEALALEWERHGIHVTCVKPPIINTQMGAAAGMYLSDTPVPKLEPIVVAETIEKAIHRGGTSHVIGTGSKIWGLLDRWLPEAGREWVARKVLGFK
ncbi:SDR family NAD(P)-dependent oxidoreductase [Aequoribacter fuscus]|nr:SDR family NAD(P)-dependent oxidoreductase [Aequoribacter fuscus]QHJ88643.1 SDR family NAD(P)-dependent oxidoreductase [Aequoribacter fuscus]